MKNRKLIVFICLAAMLVFVRGSEKKGVVHWADSYMCDDFKALDNMIWWHDFRMSLSYFHAKNICSSTIDNYKKTHVPMVWGYWSKTKINIADEAQYILGFNEPNHKKQSNMTPKKAAAAWREVEKHSKGKPLVSPSAAVCGKECLSDEITWFDKFFELCKGCRVDYLATHTYWCNPEKVMTYLKMLSTKYKRKIWLTEFACSRTKNQRKQLNFMKRILPKLEAADYIYRYSWYSARIRKSGFITTAASLLEPYSSKLTPLGRYYNDFQGLRGKAATIKPKKVTTTQSKEITTNPDPNPTLPEKVTTTPPEEEITTHTGNVTTTHTGNKTTTHTENRTTTHTGNVTITHAENGTTTHPVNVTSTHTGNVTSTHPGNITSTHSGNVTSTHIGNATSRHTGNVTSTHTGNFTSTHTGNVTSTHTVNVTSTHTGNVTSTHPGNITSTHPGNVTTTHPGKVTTTHPVNVTTTHPVNITTTHPGNITTTHPGNVTTTPPVNVATTNLGNVPTTPPMKVTTSHLRKVTTTPPKKVTTLPTKKVTTSTSSQEDTSKETLLILQSYTSNPTAWWRIINFMKKNSNKLPESVRVLYKTSSKKQLRQRIKKTFNEILCTDVDTIQTREIREIVEKVRSLPEKTGKKRRAWTLRVPKC